MAAPPSPEPLKPRPERFRSRLAGALLAGALAAAAAAVAAGYLLRFAGARIAAEAVRRFLTAGGWLWMPLWGAAAGALAALPWCRGWRTRSAVALLALLLALSPLVLRARVPELLESGSPPRTALGKANALRRWAYRSPEAVARILPYAADPNPVVREQAALALGINLIVSDVEHADRNRPAHFAQHPLRDSLRARLRGALADPVEAVRAEAARALLKAPITFGPEPEAADTLAAMLDRADRPEALERLAWLALDAAAVSEAPALRQAAARFAARTPDTTLRRIARAALARRPG
jgi:hypothetical protein